MTIVLFVLSIVTVASVGFSVYVFSTSKKSEATVPKLSEDEAVRIAGSKSKQILDSAEKEASEIVNKSRKKLHDIQKHTDELDTQLVRRESNLVKREKLIDRKVEDVDSIRSSIKQKEEQVDSTRKRLETQLEKVSELSREDARDLLRGEIAEDMKNYYAKKLRDTEKKIEEEADDKAMEILVTSMQKVATDYVGETTVSRVKIDNEKVKGRVIGREGRNIRSFEKATGVDVIVDEAPDSITLSSFDPLRREIAAIAMKKLLVDGRIHPGRIEELVAKAKSDVSKEIKKNGQILAEEGGWPGIDIGLLKLLGKMKYRRSYGQSLMKHTIEVIRLGAALAQEVNADVELVKKACLLHDVGKVLSHKIEGAHHHLSGKIARKYNLSKKLVNAIEAHHLDIEPESIEAVIVYIADAISGARPGARKDSYDDYIKRVKGIEDVAKKVAGNQASEIYAIHAGREVRVIVKPEMISDDDIVILANKISKEIEKSQTYPGMVQVMVIRESRAISTAK